MRNKTTKILAVLVGLVMLGTAVSAVGVPSEREPDYQPTYNELLPTWGQILGITPSKGSYEPGETVEMDVLMTFPAPDHDYEDGTYERQGFNWVVIDQNDNIYKQGTWTEVNGRVDKNITSTAPSTLGDYAFAGIVRQNSYEYSGGSWSLVNEETINKDAKTFEVSPGGVPGPEAPNIQEFLSGIIDWIKNLFTI